MNPMAEMTAAVADAAAYARNLNSETRGRTVGYVCSYTPEELILAAGAHPFRLLGTKQPIRRADAHLQTYCCSLVRGILEEALSGNLDFLDGMVFPHTCDSIQRLSDIWRLNIPFGFHADVVMPVKLTTASARDYMADVLRKFRRDLEQALSVTITDQALREAVDLTNSIRAALRRLYELRAKSPGLVSGTDVHAVVRASMIMDRRRFRVLLEEYLAEAAGKTAPAGAKPPVRLILSGGVCNAPDVYGMIAEAGGAVVWDDLCTGGRYFETPVPATPDPVEGIADRLTRRVVCPAKHRGLTDRADHLVGLVREKDARGVIFLLLKFCDPHAFDYPCLKAALDREGIPSLLMEVEDPLPPEGQLRTRIEAFLEML
jgi:bzd-type benzoyl-CoA reductase N subunit